MIPDYLRDDVKITQEHVAQTVGVDVRTIKSLVKKKVLPKSDKNLGLDLVECVQTYIAYKIDVEVKRNSVKQLPENLIELEIEEKKNKILIQREDIKAKRLKRHIVEGKYFPAPVMIDALSQTITAVRQILDSILPRFKMVSPDISSVVLDEFDKIITMALNEIANFEPDLSAYRETDDSEFEDSSESSQESD